MDAQVSLIEEESDPAVVAVAERLRALAGPDPAALFGECIRRSIDEVLDGARTGRWDFTELEKTEKTYVGTKLEIVIRSALGLERGETLDLELEGHPVDVKWAMDSAWQIPLEAVDQICLCVGGRRHLSEFQVGVIRCRLEYLNQGKNRDVKKTLTAATVRKEMKFLVERSPMPTNFLAEIDADVRAEVMAAPTIQTRVTKLFTLVPRTPIPRGAIATVARTTGDPMRRLRADVGAGDPLHGMTILSAKYGNAVAMALGYRALQAGEHMSIPRAEIDGLSISQRRALPQHVRTRFDLD